MIWRGRHGVYSQLQLLTALAVASVLLAVSEARTVDHSEQFYWKTDEWGTCFVAEACGFGIRERSVWCADRDTDKPALEYSCKAVDEPPRTKQCFIACRHHKGHLEWQTSDWGVCVVSTDDEIGDGNNNDGNEGVMERSVSCVLTSHNHTQVSIVIDDENCLSVGKRPPSTSECTLPTRQECVLSEWTEWTPCCNFKQWRIRSVLVAPHYGARPCPQLSEWKTCSEEDSTECDSEFRTGKETESQQTRLRVERWGDCKPNLGELEWDGDSSGHADNYYKHWPQVGTQRRAITCLSTTGATLDLTECLTERNDQGLPMRERACIISQDCSVSEWSEWEVIQEGCIDPNGNEWPEIMERSREILRLHEGQGKNCPHLIETKETKSNLPLCSHKYRWVTSKWSGCTLPGVIGTVVCGGGLQFKNVSCVKADSGQPVSNDKCKTMPPPPSVQRCEVACARDCEVSQWGPWSPCKPHPDVCSTAEPPHSHLRRGQRIRQRSVVVAPSDLGLECPSLSEVQPCQHPKCYVWKLEPWSSCYLLNIPQAKCGTGSRSRKVTCVTHDEEPVPDSFCSELKPQVKETCLIPCPYDCVVSPWSSWTPCSQPCSMGSSIGLHSRNRTIIAPPGQDGHLCPPPDEFMEIEPCNLHGCHGYSWLTLPWQDCNATCDREGYQFREIWCVDNQERVPDEKCYSLKRPNDLRPCTKECPAECQVSPWSEWTTCDAHICYPNGSRGKVREQVKYRVVLEGTNCGPLVETSPCPPAPEEPCPTYSWTTGNWSHCLLATGVRCGHGLRTRDLWCINDQTGERVELRFCLKNQQNALPVSIQRCHADCHSPCQLTEWSSWSGCKQPCQGAKERTRQLIGLSGRHEVCKGLPLRETTPCPCSENYQEYLSEWSPCLSNETSLVSDTGTRYKAIGCFDKKGGQLVDPSLCGGSSGLIEEPCMISRPVDCILGEWSSWGECSTPCGPGLHNRTREIERNASHGGRPCGDTVETKVCNIPCDAFQWQTGGWSECNLLASYKILGCGNGEQYRQIRCVDIRTNTQITDDLCDWTTKPETMNACHVACPGDCVLSPWSDWSICPKGCLENSYQQRTRTELRAAANNGAHCPHSIQTQACQLNVTCFTYQWITTNFSSCLPLGGSPCGEGVTNRAVYCLRSDNRPVADSWCSDMQKPEPSEKWCYKDCPVDCQISEWSEWNTSKCHCGQSGMTRHATVITNPSSTGRPCPELFQWKPCPVLPCYTWSPSEWTTCQLHGAACGHGVRTRNVTCIRVSDNGTADPWHCSGGRRPPIWETCHSPCDTDCLLSEWSPWSDCHATCDKDKLGYQTRSRAVIRPPASAGAEPCPEALWETQPCEPGPCYTYDWTVTATGDILCTRSDGLHVIGGCNGKHKPKPAACRWIQEKCVCDDGAIVLQQNACASDRDGIQAKIFFPNDDLSFWMFAMIGIGCVFIIFVAASIYLLCNSTREVGMGYHPAK